MEATSKDLASTLAEKQIRITSQGKMKSWIAFALTFFENPEDDKILTLHTLPAIVNEQTSVSTSTVPPTLSHKTASTATSVVPRLISVAEIIKREYVKSLEVNHSSRVIGLHQYNELGTLEELGIVVAPAAENAEVAGIESAEKSRAQQIIHALSGHNHPRQTQTPFMRITLSTHELPELIVRGAHYQPPILRKISKSAKARAKKRAKAKSKELMAEPRL